MRAAVILTVRGAGSIQQVLRATPRALAYLLTGPVAGAAGLLWSLAATVTVTVLSITQLGGPTFLAASWVTRRLAGLERHRAGWQLGTPIETPYVPTTGGTIRRRVAAVAAQPATWRDLAWLIVLFPIGLASGIAAAVTTAVTAGAIIAPLWLWAVPNPRAPFPADPLMTTPAGRLALVPIGLLLLPAAAWLIRRLAQLQARTAQALLAPGTHRRLVDETTRLTETRRRVVDAQAAELRRIERDLHDGAQARIVAAGMTLALAARKLRAPAGSNTASRATGSRATDGDHRGEPAATEAGPVGSTAHAGVGTDHRGEAAATDQVGNTAAAAADVELARRQLDEALAELRRLVRGIHPPILGDRGLHAALAALAGDSPLAVAVHGDPTARYPAAVESAAYFVVAEGLTNAAKHADATACVVTTATTETTGTGAGTVTVTVTDDGRGGADPAGSGLDGLRRRVEALDGELTITSPPGGPTVLRAEFPCAS
jgi:signal transduction histidine kinase